VRRRRLRVQKNWFVNFDVKYVRIATDVKAGGATVTNLKIEPLLYGIGVGYRF
jgi:outer membrane protein